MEFTSEKAKQIWHEYDGYEKANKLNAYQHDEYSEARARLKAIASAYNNAKEIIYRDFGKNKKEA